MGFPSLHFRRFKSKRSYPSKSVGLRIDDFLNRLFAIFAVFMLRLLPQDQFRGWKEAGILMGTLLFVAIVVHADTAMAQLFNSAEQQATSIFGQYIDSGIITFLFGLLRIVVWVSAVGFVLFAVYQAQRGEQWQPLMQNAFIVVAAVILVEALSALFFGGGTTATPKPSPSPTTR